MTVSIKWQLSWEIISECDTYNDTDPCCHADAPKDARYSLVERQLLRRLVHQSHRERRHDCRVTGSISAPRRANTKDKEQAFSFVFFAESSGKEVVE